MEKFIIEGGKSLEGEIKVMGAKNSAGPALASTLLTGEECIIDNLPKVSDILGLLEILKGLGKDVEWIGERKVSIKNNNVSPENMDFEKVSKSRVSVLLMGALLGKIGEFKISHPGGDRIGLRPINIHIKALEKLGAEIEEDGDFYHIKSKELIGKEIILPEFSVTATENLMLAAVLAKGKTIIRVAAEEPQVQDLAVILNKMGAKVKNKGSHCWEIQGVEKLHGFEHRIIPDPNEAGTFLAIGAACGKDVLVKDIVPGHLSLFLEKMEEMGVDFEVFENSIRIWKPKKFNPIKVQALPYPGFPTDLLPLIIPLLTQAEGRSLLHDPLYENRLNYVQELRKMGADIEIVDPHRAFVFGKTPLHGLSIESWDIRAGASLIIAGLIAKGMTAVKNIGQIDRGYEKIEDRLTKIGANIKRNICL